MARHGVPLGSSRASPRSSRSAPSPVRRSRARATRRRASRSSPSRAVTRRCTSGTSSRWRRTRCRSSATPTASRRSRGPLVFYGRSPNEHVTLVENVSLPTQTVIETTLSQVPLLPRASRAPRAVLVVGDRAMRMTELAWLEKQPLFGRRILVTRAKNRREDGGLPPGAQRRSGGRPHDRDSSASGWRAARGRRWRASGGMAGSSLPSANRVRRLWAEIERQKLDARAFGAAKIAAIGPGPRPALGKHGLTADLVPHDHQGGPRRRAPAGDRGRKSLASSSPAPGSPATWCRTRSGRQDVRWMWSRPENPGPPEAAYRSARRPPRIERIDAVTFTSSSTVELLCRPGWSRG